MIVMTPDQAHELVVRTLVRCNTAPVNADSVARALVEAERVGEAGHGSRRLPSYGAQALSGKVDRHAVPSSQLPRPSVLWRRGADARRFSAPTQLSSQLPGPGDVRR